jgi:hypothetical protein
MHSDDGMASAHHKEGTEFILCAVAYSAFGTALPSDFLRFTTGILISQSPVQQPDEAFEEKVRFPGV